MDNELLPGALAIVAHARRPIMSAALKHFHEGRVYPRNNQHRRALFPRRCVSRPVQPLPPPSWDLIVNGNARLRIELQPPLYFLRIASIRNVRFLALSGLSCPRFDVNSSKKEKGKIEFELNWIVERERIDSSSRSSSAAANLFSLYRASSIFEKRSSAGAVCGHLLAHPRIIHCLRHLFSINTFQFRIIEGKDFVNRDTLLSWRIRWNRCATRNIYIYIKRVIWYIHLRAWISLLLKDSLPIL